MKMIGDKPLTQNERIKRYRSTEKGRLAVLRHRFSKYGITPIEYDRLYQIQQGRCAICKTHQTELGRMLSVDHNHTTGKVRGLLCDLCNSILGHAKDSVEVLETCIEYLREK